MVEQNKLEGTVISSLVTRVLEKKRKHKEELELTKRPTLEEALFAQFNVLEMIKKPGRGTVIYHLAKKDDPSKQLCCKALLESDNAIHQKLLINEATKLEICQHPNTLNFIKVGTELRTPYFMAEWVSGESLAQKIHRHNEKGFRHDHVAWLVYQIAGALEYMHSNGICHLDIKPSNILVDQENVVKLIDFGAAQYFNEKSEVFEASMNYASPEYIESGDGKLEDDVFSLAVVTYHLFLGTAATDNIAALLKKQKRPDKIPKHVWKLLKKVIVTPRAHGYSPITFAQALGLIDVKHELGGVPIFTNLRNADLVLSRTKPIISNIVGSWKYLEISLISAVCVLVFAVLIRNVAFYQTYQESLTLKASQKVIDLASRYSTNLFNEEPWIAETTLNKLIAEAKNEDVENMQILKQHFASIDSKERERYEANKGWIIDQQSYSRNATSKFVDIQKKIVMIRQRLDQSNIKPDKELDNLFLTLLADVGDATQMNEMSLNYFIKPVDIVTSIESGKAKLVGDYLKSSWERSQAQSYYFSRILREQAIDEIANRANKLAQKNHYTKAINLVLSAKKFFGGSVTFADLEEALFIARGEFVLYSAVNGVYDYDTRKIEKAFNDIRRFSPQKAQTVRNELQQIITQRLSESHVKGANSDGVMNVKKALFSQFISEV